MAYIRKIIAPEENLIGIARCHWIYVVKGLVWFAIMAIVGWAINKVIMTFAFMLSGWADNPAAPLLFMNLADGALWICLGAGLLVFFFLVLKVLVTEVGLTTRRVVLKEGFIFVKVKDIDLEEIRGENLDLGMFGRILGYGYLKLDCRFIGDIMLPAIENPEGYLNALHSARSKTQDALSIVVGKGEKHPVTEVAPDAALVEGVDTPTTAPGQQPAQPVPEIQPGQQPTQPEIQPQPTTPTIPQSPEIPTMPTPHEPPPQTAPPSQPEQTPPPAQPIPAPVNPEPPLQPPSGQVQAQPQQQQQQPVQQTPPQPPQQQPVVDSAAVAQAMEQVMPHMVEEVVKQMAEKGLIPNKDTAKDDDIDTALISSFDEASEEGSNAVRNKVEHVIH